MPDHSPRSRTHRFKLDSPLRAAAKIHGGLQPDLLDEAGFWQQDDIWVGSLEALDIYVRAAADSRAVTVADLCAELAAHNSLTLGLTQNNASGT